MSPPLCYCKAGKRHSLLRSSLGFYVVLNTRHEKAENEEKAAMTHVLNAIETFLNQENLILSFPLQLFPLPPKKKRWGTIVAIFFFYCLVIQGLLFTSPSTTQKISAIFLVLWASRNERKQQQNNRKRTVANRPKRPLQSITR